MDKFKALMVDQKDGETKATIQELGTDALPRRRCHSEGGLLSLNYKDGLAVTGAAKVLRSYPMVPRSRSIRYGRRVSLAEVQNRG